VRGKRARALKKEKEDGWRSPLLIVLVSIHSPPEVLAAPGETAASSPQLAVGAATVCQRPTPSSLFFELFGKQAASSSDATSSPVQMPHLLLERKIRLYLRVSGSGKVKAKNGVIGICRAGLETLRAL